MVVVFFGSVIKKEKIPVSDRLSDVTPSPYPFLLDRQISTTTDTPTALRVPSGTYNAITKKTTWTLTYSAAAKTEAWSGYDTSSNGGVLLGSTTSGNQIVADGLKKQEYDVTNVGKHLLAKDWSFSGVMLLVSSKK